MENKNNPNRVEQTARDLADYGHLRMDAFRLSLIDNLSTLFSTLFSVFVFIMLAGIAGMFLAVALTWGLGLLIGSLFAAAMIIAGIFLILAIIVFALRKKLIVNQAVRMLSKMISDMTQKYSDYE